MSKRSLSYVGSLAGGRLRIERDGDKIRDVLLSSPARWFPYHLGSPLPTKLADLADLATTIYGVDRLSPRGNLKNGDLSWCRHLTVRVPVRERSFWKREALLSPLKEMLDFLTEDQWEFEFAPRVPAGNESSVQLSLIPPRPPVVAGLFSAGLDSLAGLSIDFLKSDYKTLVPVAIASNSRLLNRQRELLHEIHRHAPNRVRPVVLVSNIRQSHRDYDQNERSQRSRGFLYGCLGAIAARMAGAKELRIYEGGIGAINLPITPAQLGIQSTRSTHPLFLSLLADFLKLVFDQEFTLSLPCALLTKGEMCACLKKSPWRQLAIRTVSCDGFPSRQPGGEQCGVCTSCILRRLSLFASNFEEDRDSGLYRVDFLHGISGVPESQIRPLADMLSQANRIKYALLDTSPWLGLTTEFPEMLTALEGFSSLGSPCVKEELVGLYSRYCREWAEFPARPPCWSLAA